MQIRSKQNILLAITIGITFLGMCCLKAISHTLFISQGVKFIVSLALIYFTKKLPLNFWQEFAGMLYILGIALLSINLFQSYGVKRWISIFGFFIQFSEFVKIIFSIALANFLTTHELNKISIAQYSLLVLVPVLLIFKQPNLGNALICSLVAIGMILFKGLNKKFILSCVLFGMIISPFIWQKLLPYQKSRIVAFLHPNADPRGLSYQTMQSIIAIGAGGILGSEGLQNKLGFVPENYTDFLFSYFAETNGFILTLLLLLLLLSGMMQLIYIIETTHKEFNKFFCLGFLLFWFIECFFNIGMNIGILPVAGIAFPCFSYGGSALISFFLGIGIILNITKQEK